MILAETPDEETAALEELRAQQESDFVGILEAMDGLPVTVRLLDPPLHEFLPDHEELIVKEALGTITEQERKLLARVGRCGASRTRCSARAAAGSASSSPGSTACRRAR